MKKIFLVASMAAVVLTSVNAQNKYKPENMSFSTELNYSPGGATTDGQFSLPDYGAKVRLHLNEKMAVRLKHKSRSGCGGIAFHRYLFIPGGSEQDRVR